MPEPTKQQNPPNHLIPSFIISNNDKDGGLQAELNTAFAKHLQLNRSKSPHIEANLVGDNSGSPLTSVDLPSRDMSTNDTSKVTDKEYMGYFILPRPEEEPTFKPIVYLKNAPLHYIPPRDVDMPLFCYTSEYNGPYRETRTDLQPAMPSHHDGPFDTRSPAIAARVSPFVAESNLFGLDSTRPPCKIDEPEHYEGSTAHAQGSGSDKGGHTLHSAQYYLKFTDNFRETLAKGVPMFDDELDLLSSVLEGILAREAIGDNLMPFSTIVFTRFEKLLTSLIDHSGRNQHSARQSFKNAVDLAAIVQRRWQIRFHGKLFSTDDERTRYMLKYGLLVDVAVEPSRKVNGIAKWVAQTQRLGAGTDLINFQLGKWWLNTACALRDGVVNLTGDKKVGPHQLVTYLTLLRGVETYNPESGCIVYEFEGKLEIFLTNLHDKVGKKVRLIRGYKLKSRNAPKIGIRYDGSYMLRRYGLKLLDTTTQLYRLVLHIEAIQGESGFDEDMFKPSLKDDWELYKKIEKAEMKRLCSKTCYDLWQTEEENEVKDIQEWHRREKFKEQAKNLNL